MNNINWKEILGFLEDYEKFINYVVKNYKVEKSHVWEIIKSEYTRIRDIAITGFKEEETPENIQKWLSTTIKNCKKWLELPRQDIKPEDLAIYGKASLYFQAIKKRI